MRKISDKPKLRDVPHWAFLVGSHTSMCLRKMHPEVSEASHLGLLETLPYTSLHWLVLTCILCNRTVILIHFTKSFWWVTEPEGIEKTLEFIASWSETQLVWEPGNLEACGWPTEMRRASWRTMTSAREACIIPGSENQNHLANKLGL